MAEGQGENQNGNGGGADKPWFDGYDADLTAHIQNRGWDKLPLKDAVAQAVKSHREAEKLIGVPQEQLLRFPKDINDKDAYKAIYNRLGKPADVKEYDFKGVQFADKTDLEESFTNDIRSLADKLNLSKDGAVELAKSIVGMIDKGEADETTEYTTKLAAEKETLKTNWGAANYNANKIIAENAAAKLGIDAEGVSALEKVVGYAKVMEMFRKIGAQMGEDKFVTNGGGGGGALTKEQAEQKLSALEKDDEWQKKYWAGDTATVQEFNNLTRIVAGV